MKQIRIKINQNGTIEAETIGITGKKCEDYISMLEGLLEARTQSSKYTDDYYLPETTGTATAYSKGRIENHE